MRIIDWSSDVCSSDLGTTTFSMVALYFLKMSMTRAARGLIEASSSQTLSASFTTWSHSADAMVVSSIFLPFTRRSASPPQYQTCRSSCDWCRLLRKTYFKGHGTFAQEFLWAKEEPPNH